MSWIDTACAGLSLRAIASKICTIFRHMLHAGLIFKHNFGSNDSI